MTELVPSSHHDLLGDQAKALAFLAATTADGAPHVTPVWFDVAGDLIRVNTARGRVKYWNMLRRPRVALAISDREDPYRYIQIRGSVVGSTEDGARDHISLLAKKYRGWDTYPVPEGQVRVIFTIRPERVSVGS